MKQKKRQWNYKKTRSWRVANGRRGPWQGRDPTFRMPYLSRYPTRLCESMCRSHAVFETSIWAKITILQKSKYHSKTTQKQMQQSSAPKLINCPKQAKLVQRVPRACSAVATACALGKQQRWEVYIHQTILMQRMQYMQLWLTVCIFFTILL